MVTFNKFENHIGFVMKYTDMVTASDVMDAAKEICMRSGIKYAEKLRAGDEIKIPLDLLSHQRSQQSYL